MLRALVIATVLTVLSTCPVAEGRTLSMKRGTDAIIGEARLVAKYRGWDLTDPLCRRSSATEVSCDLAYFGGPDDPAADIAIIADIAVARLKRGRVIVVDGFRRRPVLDSRPWG